MFLFWENCSATLPPYHSVYILGSTNSSACDFATWAKSIILLESLENSRHVLETNKVTTKDFIRCLSLSFMWLLVKTRCVPLLAVTLWVVALWWLMLLPYHFRCHILRTDVLSETWVNFHSSKVGPPTRGEVEENFSVIRLLNECLYLYKAVCFLPKLRRNLKLALRNIYYPISAMFNKLFKTET